MVAPSTPRALQRVQELRMARRRHADEQAAGSLRIQPEVNEGLLHAGMDDKVLAEIFPIAFDGAGDNARTQRLQAARERGQRLRVDA